nr:MAG TPA: hypothetical protein [Caudoviricetes sp.]
MCYNVIKGTWCSRVNMAIVNSERCVVGATNIVVVDAHRPMRKQTQEQ